MAYWTIIFRTVFLQLLQYLYTCCVAVGHLDALLRSLVLGKLGKAGHKPTLEEARRRFKEHVEGKQILPADLRSPVGDLCLPHNHCV